MPAIKSKQSILALSVLFILSLSVLFIIIIIAFKGAIQVCFFLFFYNLLTAPQTVSNTYVQVARAQPCANHRALITCKCHVTCHLVRRDSSAIKLDSWIWNCIYLSFILLAEPLHRWRRGGNQSTRRKPLATSFRKCHILQPEDSSPKRDSNPHSSIGGRLGKQTC